MSIESVTLQKIEGIYDIQPILKPEHSSLETTLLFFIIIMLMIFFLYIPWTLFFSKKAIAKRKIQALKIQHQNKKITTHDTVYELCLVLRNGLNLKNINTKTTLPPQLASNKAQWNNFIEKTDLLRYKKESDSKYNIDSLFDESLFWLKTWP